MYTKKNVLFLCSSASHCGQNLSFLSDLGSTRLASAHRESVNLLSWDGDDPAKAECREVSFQDNDSPKKEAILQVKLVELTELKLLTIVTESGVEFYESDGSSHIFTYIFPQLASDEGEGNGINPGTSAKGVAAIGSNVFIGHHDGDIIAFSVEKSDTSIEITEQERIKGHRNAVYDLHSEFTRLVSGDAKGCVSLWSANGSSLEIVVQFEGFNSFPCTSVCIHKDMICAAYGSGHLRVFSVSQKRLLSEAVAHSRWITALDVAPQTGLILSASEDTFLRVWQMDESCPHITCKFDYSLSNTQLIGGQFLEKTGDTFAVVGYDSQQVHLFGV